MSVAALVVTSFASFVGPARAAELDISTFYNNVGISQDPISGSNFDGGGFSYSELALQIGDPINGIDGVEPGDTIEIEGASFTWPETASGANDNIASLG